MGRTTRQTKTRGGKKSPKKPESKKRGLKGSIRNLNIEEDYGSFEKFNKKR